MNQFQFKFTTKDGLMLSVTRIAIVVAESQWPYYSKWLWLFGFLANQRKTLFRGPSSTKPRQTNARCGSFKEGFAKIQLTQKVFTGPGRLNNFETQLTMQRVVE